MDSATTPIESRRSRSRTVLAAVLSTTCLLALGCGKAGSPQGRVAGKVTLDSRPLGAGQVHLYSKTRGTGARTTLDAAGHFKMPAPLPVGEYTAMVTPPPPTVVPGVSPRSTPAGGSNPATPAVAIPVMYWSETTSDLVVKVEADKEVVVALELRGDGQPAPATPAATSPNVDGTPSAESPAPAEAGEKDRLEKTPGDKGKGEKGKGEKGTSEKTADEKTAVAVAPAATPKITSNPSPPASATAGAPLPTWLLPAIGGGGLLLAAVAAGTFILLRRRSAPAPGGWTPAPPQPVSAPAGPGQSAAYPRFARPPGADKPGAHKPGADQSSSPAETHPAAQPAQRADRPAVATTNQTAAPAETPSAVPAKETTVPPPEKNAPAEEKAAASSQTTQPSAVPPFEERPLERTIAAWVLQRGGRLRLRSDGRESGNVSQAAEIPARPFRVTAVLFAAHDILGLDDLERLAGLEDLHLLDLTATNVTDAGLRHVAHLKHLRELSLSKTKITDNGLKILGEMRELRVLLLYRTAVTDAGLAHLHNCTSLQLVELTHTQVTDAGLQLLVALPRLEQLFVEHTRVSLEGIARISAAFPSVRINALASTAAAEPRAAEEVGSGPHPPAVGSAFPA